ncbi:MAG: pilus assembly PilX N-terminal domain-containing protein [Pseudomonadota bacterium]
MNKKKDFRNQGMILVTALVILAAITIGTFAVVNNVTLELQAVGNLKRTKQAFFAADGGRRMVPQFIESALNKYNANPSLSAYNRSIKFREDDAPRGGGSFYNEINGYIGADDDTVTLYPDITINYRDMQVTIDIRKLGNAVPAGGNSGFPPGPPTYIRYNINSAAFGADTPLSGTIIGSQYLYKVKF